jgi:hypothetical protein
MYRPSLASIRNNNHHSADFTYRQVSAPSPTPVKFIDKQLAASAD